MKICLDIRKPLAHIQPMNKTNNETNGTKMNDTTTLEDLQATIESQTDYCYEMGISIEDANN